MSIYPRLFRAVHLWDNVLSIYLPPHTSNVIAALPESWPYTEKFVCDYFISLSRLKPCHFDPNPPDNSHSIDHDRKIGESHFIQCLDIGKYFIRNCKSTSRYQLLFACYQVLSSDLSVLGWNLSYWCIFKLMLESDPMTYYSSQSPLLLLLMWCTDICFSFLLLVAVGKYNTIQTWLVILWQYVEQNISLIPNPKGQKFCELLWFTGVKSCVAYASGSKVPGPWFESQRGCGSNPNKDSFSRTLWDAFSLFNWFDFMKFFILGGWWNVLPFCTTNYCELMLTECNAKQSIRLITPVQVCYVIYKSNLCTKSLLLILWTSRFDFFDWLCSWCWPLDSECLLAR